MTQKQAFGYETTGAVLGLVAGVAIFQLFLAQIFQQPSNGEINLVRLISAGLCGGIGAAVGYFFGSLLARAGRAGGP
jgi:hypothetical protein